MDLCLVPSSFGSGSALSAPGPSIKCPMPVSDRTTGSLPALHDTSQDTWATSFTSIAAHLARLDPAWDLDAPLSPAQKADSTAYTAFLASTAPPLIALSLYVSSANWAAATRPAYSSVLPFPLTWTEPLVLRSRMSAVADHLGLSDLNIDDEPEETKSRSSGEDARGFLKIPERLRPRRTGVRASLSPEQTNLFRLEAAGRECLGVLAGLKEQHDEGRFLFGGERPTALDCLALGYLALMLAPEVPRPWLRDLLRRRYEGLCVCIDAMRDELFGGDVASLPWLGKAGTATATEGAPWRVTRFARGVVGSAVPGDWLLGEEKDAVVVSGLGTRRRSRVGVALRALGNSLAGLGLVGSLLLYRHLSPFGAALYRWEGLRRRSFGAAGAFFGI